jgi:tellurite resistance protein TerC
MEAGLLGIGAGIAVGLAGATVLAFGIALIVLPGPAVVVIPAGLAILAIEFAWARRWLERIRDGSGRLIGSLRAGFE